jgi:hypothetical protein
MLKLAAHDGEVKNVGGKVTWENNDQFTVMLGEAMFVFIRR